MPGFGTRLCDSGQPFAPALLRSLVQMDPRTRRLERALRIGVIGLGLLQAWATRDYIANDAISYLDLGDAFWRREWSTAINGMWNPLYGVLASAVVRWTGVSPAHEYAAVHALVFGIYVLTVFAFGFFLRQLLSEPGPEPPPEPRDPRAWLLLGYAIFAWSSLDGIRVSTTEPDMLVAACVYLASGLTVRIQRQPGRLADFVWLGLVLGLGYLTKSFVLVAALFFLAAAGLSAIGRTRVLPRVLSAVAALLVVAAPFAAALSLQRGRVTVGETGRINYAWSVNHVRARHWQGGPEGAGAPAHPTRRLRTSPPTYEFDRPMRVTYPQWFDPSYWYEGVRVRLQPAQQLGVLAGNLFDVADWVGARSVFLFSLLVLALLRPRWRAVGAWLRGHGAFLLPSLAAILIYASVHVEERYIGAFLAILLLGAFRALAAGEPRCGGPVVRAIAIAAWVLLVSPGIGRAGSPRYYGYLTDPMQRSTDFTGGRDLRRPIPWHVAAAATASGLSPGDRVGAVQYANFADAAWARLARVKIIAEVKPEADEPDFWHVPARDQEDTVAAMARAGAVAVVSDVRPSGTADLSWVPMGDTGYYLHWIGSKSRSRGR